MSVKGNPKSPKLLIHFEIYFEKERLLRVVWQGTMVNGWLGAKTWPKFWKSSTTFSIYSGPYNHHYCLPRSKNSWYIKLLLLLELVARTDILFQGQNHMYKLSKDSYAFTWEWPWGRPARRVFCNSVLEQAPRKLQCEAHVSYRI